MPRPLKRYFDPNNPPVPVLHNGHPVIPLPALQGLIRALLLQKKKVPANKKDQLEQFLLVTAYSFSDPRLIRRCEEDESPYHLKSVAQAAAYVEGSIASILKPCHPSILQAHAQLIDDLLNPYFLKVKKARTDYHREVTLCEHLKRYQTLLLKSVACTRPHPQASSLPPDTVIRSWGRRTTPAQLRNKILAYYHGLKSARYVGQLLAGRTT